MNPLEIRVIGIALSRVIELKIAERFGGIRIPKKHMGAGRSRRSFLLSEEKQSPHT